jgi:hypothetical protein
MTIESYQDALELAEELITTIEEDLSESAYARSPEFFDSALEGVKGTHETIECTEDVTEGQIKALENWKAGVEKWLHR